MIDLERSAAEDAYLDNNSVSSFEWLKIKVKVGSRASDVNPKRIIDAVDGLVEAGKLAILQQHTLLLTRIRGSDGHNGSIWLGKDNSPQRPC